MGVALRNIVRELHRSRFSVSLTLSSSSLTCLFSLSPSCSLALSLAGYLSSACISWTALSIYANPRASVPPASLPGSLREDLHYKYAPTGMHVRQYDVSLPFSFSVSPFSFSPSRLCMHTTLRFSPRYDNNADIPEKRVGKRSDVLRTFSPTREQVTDSCSENVCLRQFFNPVTLLAVCVHTHARTLNREFSKFHCKQLELDTRAREGERGDE